MLNKRRLYLFLLICTISSLFITGLFLYVLIGALLVVIFFNRGLFYTVKANKYLVINDFDIGYALLTKAYKTKTLPMVIINGFIYLSLKLGFNEAAKEAIDDVLSGRIPYKLKDGQRNLILTQKSIYLWKAQGLQQGVDLLEDIYSSGYRTTIFYGNFGCMLFLNGNFDRAQEICLEAYDFDSTDKVILDNLVALNIKLEKWELADKYFNELMDLSPSFPEAYYHGAILMLHKKQKEEGAKLINRAKEYPVHCISSISQKDIDDISDLCC